MRLRLRMQTPLLLVAITLLVASCDPDMAGTRRELGEVRNTTTTAQPAAPAELAAPPVPVLNDELVLLPDGREVRLQEGRRLGTITQGTIVGAPYGGSSAALAGDRLWYTTQRRAENVNRLPRGAPLFTPELWAFDTATGANTKMVDGAMTIAPRADGLLAYAKGVDAPVRNGERWMAHVVVSRQPGVDAKTWTKQPIAMLGVLGWAGSTLLVNEALIDDEGGRVLAFDGPGRSRLLHDGSLVAISSDGTHAVFVDGADSGDGPSLVLLDVATGTERSRLRGPFAADADWRGNRLVMQAGTSEGRTLAVLEVGPDHQMRQTASIPAPPDLRFGYGDVTFVDDSRILVTGELGDRSGRPDGVVYAVCDIETGRCRRGPVRDGFTLTPVPSGG